MRIGHNMEDEELFDRVKKHWCLKGPFPLPKFKMRCPVCNAEDNDIILRQVTTALREYSPHKYRANVSFKCTQCSFTWTHGVVLPDEVLRKWGIKGTKSKVYDWRQICKELNAPFGIKIKDIVKDKECSCS